MTVNNSGTPTAEEFVLTRPIPVAKFSKVSDFVTGVIAEQPTVVQQKDVETGELLYWKDGNPRYQVILVLATEEIDPEIEEDDGQRRIYVKGQLTAAFRTAMRKAGATVFQVGDKVTVSYVGDGKRTNPRFNPPKVYHVDYVTR